MKGTIRIISGLMKGRVIPFNSARFNNAEITPQKVKGALFSIIGENLSGKTFVDLYSGSGQIGFEALSRKCSLVIFNEKDKLRFEFIKNFISQSGTGDRTLALNLNADTALKRIADRGVRADVIFLDPPYEKEKGATDFYDRILEDISQSGILHGGSDVVVQHFSANELPEVIRGLGKTGVRKYGSTSLSLYRLI